ncbi:MAG TPA: mechanosensitive ion channel family protein [Actinomycetota bacterium]|nr:mechanosensitive ion channel family protein [Actinomycetota bacterium]
MSANSRRRRTHYIRAAAAALVALIGSVVSGFGNIHHPSHTVGNIAPALVGAVIVLLGGSAAVRELSAAVREGASERAGEARGATIARIVSGAGYVIVALWTLSAVGISIQALLLGGALTGVVLGIAAQQTLGNVFAGLVLLVVRPFVVGQETVVKSTLGEYEGVVENIGLFYVTLQTPRGRVDIPNAVALASAVGPGARTAPPAEKEEPASEPEGQPSGT